MKALPLPKKRKRLLQSTDVPNKLELLRRTFVATFGHPSCALTARSAATYTSAINLFFAYLAATGAKQLTRSHIEAFQGELLKDWTRAQRKWRPETAEAAYSVAYQNIVVAALRYFFKWARRRKIINYLPAITATKPKAPDPDNLSAKEVRCLLRFAAEKIGRAKNSRARQHFLQLRALLSVLVHSGLRIAEAVNLQWSNLRQHKKTWVLVVSRGKGGKERHVPVNKELLSVLQHYREAARRYKKTKSAYGPMFRSAQRGDFSITTRTAQYAIDKLYKECRRSHPRIFEKRKIHPHLFRHTMGTLLAEKKVEAGIIQRILGHSNVGITEQYYIKRSQEQLAKTAKFYGRLIGD